jgi:hypothetical protein
MKTVMTITIPRPKKIKVPPVNMPPPKLINIVKKPATTPPIMEKIIHAASPIAKITLIQKLSRGNFTVKNPFAWSDYKRKQIPPRDSSENGLRSHHMDGAREYPVAIKIRR